MSGPAPKRESQRRRRNKDGGEVERGTLAVDIDQPEIREGLHPRADEWYRSLATSGQAEFYTESDWQVALICAEAIDMFMDTGRATLLAEIRALQSQLLATEGERRRARLELERVTEEVPADVSDLDEHRRRLKSG